MNQVWDKVDFLHADKRQSLLQVHTTLFDRRGETCADSQPKCKITRRAIPHKGFDELPQLFIQKAVFLLIKSFLLKVFLFYMGALRLMVLVSRNIGLIFHEGSVV